MGKEVSSQDMAVGKIGVQALQGVLGVTAARSRASAAADKAAADIAEFQRQKEEERVNARSRMSDRAREADRRTAAMVASMADNGGMGTGNASRFAGQIGGMAGIDFARIQYNSDQKIGALTAAQRAARMEAANAMQRARGEMFASVLGTTGGILETYAKDQERQRLIARQKQTGGTLPGGVPGTARTSTGISVKK